MATRRRPATRISGAEEERKRVPLRHCVVPACALWVVFAHGADSHEDDDLRGQCATDEWLECSRLVYGMLRDVSAELGRPVPLTLALFGGYRRDNYKAVLELHAQDLRICLDTLGIA